MTECKCVPGGKCLRCVKMTLEAVHRERKRIANKMKKEALWIEVNEKGKPHQWGTPMFAYTEFINNLLGK